MALPKRAEAAGPNIVGTAVAIRSIADAYHAARDIAVDIGAADFAVFFIGAARERGRLTPILDSEFPAVSTASRILSSTFGDEFVKRAANSTVPSWWSGERESSSTRAFETLGFAQQTALGLPDMPGIAFPVFAEQGGAGLACFFGTEMALDDASMPRVHGRCFVLFTEMLRLDLAQLGRAPIVSARERDCLKLTASGYTSEEIAVVLGLSVHTTNQYLTKVTLKLTALNRMHAVAKALRLGLIE